MKDAAAALALAGDERLITHAIYGGERSVGALAVADEHGVLPTGQDKYVKLAHLEAFENAIVRGRPSGRAAQNGNMFIR